MSIETPAFSRLVQLFAGPPIVIGLIVFFILSIDFQKRSTQQQQYFGEAAAAQLSNFVVQYVITDDILSLNVITAEINENIQVSSVAIYNENDDLIAQSGREADNATFFTKEIIFQDSVIGYVRVSTHDASIANHALLVLPVTIVLGLVSVAWLRPEWIVNWLYNRPVSQTENIPDVRIRETIRKDPESFLVVRIRPAQHLARHFAQFFQAAKQFNGIVEQTTPEELVIHFEGEDSMFAAASTGVLFQQMSKMLNGNMTFGGTLDLAEEDSNKRLKAASYLASIAKDDLIIARGEELLGNRATLKTFHHSLVDSKNLRLISEIKNKNDLLQYASTLSRA